MIGSAHAYLRPVSSRQVDAVAGAQAPTRNALNTSISSSGRYVAFDSESRLLASDTNSDTDVYLRDLATGKLWLVSIGSSGVSPVGPSVAYRPEGMSGWGADFFNRPIPLSWEPSISGNGRYVAFVSQAINLVPGDTNLTPDVFVFDRKDRSIERVSIASDGTEGGAFSGDILPDSWAPSVDGSGRRVAFTTRASLAEVDNNQTGDVYVRDRKAGKTILVSIAVDGTAATSDCLSVPFVSGCSNWLVTALSTAPSISADGRHVLFQSSANNLIEEDTNDSVDAFVRDLSKGATERVSMASDGSEIGDRDNPAGFVLEVGLFGDAMEVFTRVEHSISANGRFVVFSSRATGVIPNDDGGLLPTAGDHDYFVIDRKTRRVERVNVAPTGMEVSFTSGNHEVAAISGDGRFITFAGSMHARISPPGAPRGSAIWVHDRMTGALELTSRTSSGKIGRGCRVETTPPEESWGNADAPDISADGRYVVYRSCNSNMYDHPDEDIDNEHVLLTDRGLIVGTGGFGPVPDKPDEPDDRICIAGICIPPGGWVQRNDAAGEGTGPGVADLIGARLAYRPEYGDLFVVQEIDHLPILERRSGSRLDRVLYGLRFVAGDRHFEVRAVSHARGTFGLFECSDGFETCRLVRELEGGYGTTGERIVYSLPLDAIGGDGGAFSLVGVEAYAALGTFLSGPLQIEDRISLR